MGIVFSVCFSASHERQWTPQAATVAPQESHAASQHQAARALNCVWASGFTSIYSVHLLVRCALRNQKSPWELIKGVTLSTKLDVIKHTWYNLVGYILDLGTLNTFFIYGNGNCIVTLWHCGLKRLLLSGSGETCARSSAVTSKFKCPQPGSCYTLILRECLPWNRTGGLFNNPLILDTRTNEAQSGQQSDLLAQPCQLVTESLLNTMW